MNMQKLVLPAVAFAVGAILGRLLGLKTLMRGAMTAAAITGIGSAQPALLAAGSAVRRSAHRTRKTKPVHRAARRKTAQRKSARVAAAAQ